MMDETINNRPVPCCEKEAIGAMGPVYEALKKQCHALNLKLLDQTIHLKSSSLNELDLLTYYLNSILSHMSQGLLFINQEGIVMTCNHTAEKVLRIKTEDILFHPFSEFFKDDFFGFSLTQALKERIAPSKTFIVVERCELEVDVTFVPNLDGLIILMRDVTEMHALLEKAQRKNRMQALGEMAAMVAHEIRNPLGSIKGFASLLERDLGGYPEQERLAKNIIEGVNSLNRLVTNVLNYSRPLQLSIEYVDVIPYMHELCTYVEADASFTDRMQLKFHSIDPCIILPIDAGLFKSALLNLIVNAMQALPEGGQISLEIVKDEKNAKISVIDNGIGISKESMQKLFSPFFTTKASGNGFGLAEVHRVIQEHGGSIEVSSEEGKGTAFYLYFPLQVYRS